MTKGDSLRFEIMFGPQCAGKTTLAHSDEFINYNYVSLGEQVRSTPLESELSKRVSELIRLAKPWPAELGMQFIQDAILRANDNGKHILLDGYPRHQDELEEIDEFIKEKEVQPITAILEVTANKEILLRRYLDRDGRGENLDFYHLRYRQYEEFKEIAERYALQKGIEYRVVNTTS